MVNILTYFKMSSPTFCSFYFKTLQKAKTRAIIKELIADNSLFDNEFIHSEGRFKGLVNVEK